MSEEVLNVVPAVSATLGAGGKDHGPPERTHLRVEGPISLVDVNGKEWDLTGEASDLALRRWWHVASETAVSW